MNLDSALNLFIVEARELLADMEAALLHLEAPTGNNESINAIFRAAHTIKGSSGLFGLDHMVAFTHVMENLLDEVRDAHISIDEKSTVLLLSCCDHLRSLVDDIENGVLTPDADNERISQSLMAQLTLILDASKAQATDDHTVSAREISTLAPTEPQVERIVREGEGGGNWHISLRFGADVLRFGLDPLSFLRYLGQLGRIVDIVTVTDALPAADDMDPEACYLGFEVSFASEATRTAIDGAFEFVRDQAQIRIVAPRSQVDDYIRLIQELPDSASLLGDMLMRSGCLTEHELEEALGAQAKAVNLNQTAPKLGSILIQNGTVAPEVVDAALNKQRESSASAKPKEQRSVRVDADKLDHLINLIGELIITGASTNLLARGLHNAELIESTIKLSGLVQEVRDSALQMRMVRIGETFSRFHRVVHDISRDLGKSILLEVSGEDTELDKTVVEKIGDPLMHLVRNAMDHGIEPVETRLANGKPEKGLLRLHAFHESGSIVIEISDDGGGLKRDRILAKAIERGLVTPDMHLSDNEIFELIFEPGFSTAEQVTNLSGRGVGMDVVKRNVTALRGTIGISSNAGLGTKVSIRLPLTLAIIDGFLVSVGKSTFVIPIDAIEECVDFDATQQHNVIDLRGQVLPFIRLRDYFEIGEAESRRQSIVVVKHAGQRAGLVVDRLLGSFQTVIKPLNPIFNQVKCISGSTILGNGAVALILDVGAMLQEKGHKPIVRQIA
ncbi:MAG: chemotaxis protein CheA [Paucibacter sp.]|nr:chemotaxis protein CheA [Roseateles sp.]